MLLQSPLTPPAPCCAVVLQTSSAHLHGASRGNMRFPGRQLAAALAVLCAAVWASQAEVIDDILGSLSRAATFLERHHEQINLDGLVGFIILQGWYCKHWTELRNLGVCCEDVGDSAGVIVTSCVVHLRQGEACDSNFNLRRHNGVWHLNGIQWTGFKSHDLHQTSATKACFVISHSNAILLISFVK